MTSEGTSSKRRDYFGEMLRAGRIGRLPCATCCRREGAIKLVLEKMPEQMAERLYEIVRDRPVWWFYPDAGYDGLVKELPQGAVIYLSPGLELRSKEAVIGAVAHEIAHVVLGHLDWPPEEVGEQTEDEANEAVKAWGFNEELAAHRYEFDDVFPKVWPLLKIARDKARSNGAGVFRMLEDLTQ